MPDQEIVDSMGDQVAAYVLGAINREEAEAVRAHLGSCARCSELERRLRRVVGELPLAVDEAIPPARLRARILAAAGMSVKRSIRAGWSDEVLPLRSHICFSYSNEDWLHRSLAFLRVGLDAPGELCILYSDQADGALQALQQGYPHKVAERMEEGKLAVFSPTPDPRELARAIAARFQEGVDAGFTTIRLYGYSPAQEGYWSSDELLTWEHDWDRLASTYPAVVVCPYAPDPHGDLLRRVNLHSHISLDGLTEVNPFYSGASGNGGAAGGRGAPSPG